MLKNSGRPSPQAEWYKLYMTAVAEQDPSKIWRRIREAENAIYSLFPNLAETSDLIYDQQLIEDALASLRALEITSVR
ncbi:MAG TPA: hypothetical protein VN875_01375 [Candidatus Binatus sp.]|jgi:hypothetical protein|nr:hypothetical protein [Candidatus Binatus sp.]